MSHEDEAIELGRIAWAQVERVLGIADPVLLGHLRNGGDFWADARTAPPLVGFSFDQADTVLYVGFGTQTVAQVQGDGEERAWDARGRPVQILGPPLASNHPDLNQGLEGPPDSHSGATAREPRLDDASALGYERSRTGIMTSVRYSSGDSSPGSFR